MSPSEEPHPVPKPSGPGWTTAFFVLGGTILFGAVASALAGWFARGSFQHLLVCLLLLWSLVPLALLTLAATAVAGLRRASPQRSLFAWAAILSGSLSVLVAAGALSYVPGRMVNQWDVLEARRYCHRLIPHLEESRARNGAYPPDLGGVEAPPGTRPRLLKRNFYFSNGETYDFEFIDPAGLYHRYHYDSAQRDWERRD